MEAEDAKALRALSGHGLHTVHLAASLARERFDGDLLLAFGYIESRAHAVHRKGDAEQRERSLVASSHEVATRLAKDAGWQELADRFRGSLSRTEAPAAPTPGAAARPRR